MINLNQEYLETVIKIIRQYIPNQRVCLFGSRTKEIAKPFSDIDLAIMSENKIPLSKVAELQNAFSESDLPYRVDVVDWSVVSQEFKTAIQKDMVEIYKPGD